MDFNKATSIRLADFKSPQMRAFHITWFAFFLCFFGWFGISPLMSVVRDDLGLTAQQVGDTIIAGVFITILARLVIGAAADRVGPRLTYSVLLVLGSLPVMLIGLAQDYTQFLIFRLLIGAIGASFVITQYHTSLMFAPNIVGTANATTAGWGNLGGGVTQAVMPQFFLALVTILGSQALGWRVAMIIPGIALFIMGFVYYFFTQDTPNGNFKELREKGMMPESKGGAKGSFWAAAKDHRVWALFILYAGCFGVELIMDNTAALYFVDNFGLDLAGAGLVASLFGLMSIFARSLGGILSDKVAKQWGLRGRVFFLFVILFLEGIALIFFSRVAVLVLAIPMIIAFSITVKMSEGATYGVVPFINKKAMGSIAGIVGAGGNFGAVAAGFLFRTEGLAWADAYLILGVVVLLCSFAALVVRFSESEETAVKVEIAERLAVAAGD
jgi:NNP family nitrate/nitrite transporter-like MFS transporter